MYQVLTKEAAFIGVIKQDDKVIGELTKVVIPTTLSEQQQYRPLPQYYGGFKARGMPQNMMMKKSMPRARMAAAASMSQDNMQGFPPGGGSMHHSGSYGRGMAY